MNEAGELQGPTGELRVLQIHPTLRCNLRCTHCYSSSGPERTETLGPELLSAALTDARAEGYGIVGVSGGEPTLYRPLPGLLDHARSLGMATTVTTNGMLLDAPRLGRIAGRVDLLAISLDGVPASHARIRGSSRAFKDMAARLPAVRASGIPFGFIFTLTQTNLHELEWVAQFALEQGAKLLQIHPLEEAGRAATELRGNRPDATEATWAHVEALRIQALAGERLRVQLDLVDRGRLRAEPARAFAAPPIATAAAPLAHLLSPLVIEADGTVVPLQHGFPRSFALGDLHEARLSELAARWRDERYHVFQGLCTEVFDELSTPARRPYTNWYEAVAGAARSPGYDTTASARGATP